MEDNFVNIEIDISDEVFMELAKAAHEKNITLNELCCEIIQEYVDGKRVIDEYPLEVELRDSVSDIVTGGVTIETLTQFSKSYVHWFEEGGCNGKFLRDIIQDGFNAADDNG